MSKNSNFSCHDVSFLLSSSSEIPFVSGIIKCTKISCKTINPANTEKTIPAPIVAKSNGTNEGIIAAKTQCTLIPKDCPELRK